MRRLAATRGTLTRSYTTTELSKFQAAVLSREYTNILTEQLEKQKTMYFPFILAFVRLIYMAVIASMHGLWKQTIIQLSFVGSDVHMVLESHCHINITSLLSSILEQCPLIRSSSIRDTLHDLLPYDPVAFACVHHW